VVVTPAVSPVVAVAPVMVVAAPVISAAVVVAATAAAFVGLRDGGEKEAGGGGRSQQAGKGLDSGHRKAEPFFRGYTWRRPANSIMRAGTTCWGKFPPRHLNFG
jgi:hypothetical protein